MAVRCPPLPGAAAPPRRRRCIAMLVLPWSAIDFAAFMLHTRCAAAQYGLGCGRARRRPGPAPPAHPLPAQLPHQASSVSADGP